MNHNLATNRYNILRSEFEQALKIIQKQYPEYIYLANVLEAIIKSFQEKCLKKFIAVQCMCLRKIPGR